MIAVFDSSSLISISQSCLINLLRGLKGQGNITFAVPKSVFLEVVENPLRIKRFELNAVRLQKAFEQGWLEVKALDSEHSALAEEIGAKANHLLYMDRKPITLIHRAEMESLALLKQLDSNLLVIDERTTRTIIESPKQIKGLIERRKNRSVDLNEKNADALQRMFSSLNIVRSAEFVALAFERKLLEADLPLSRQSLEAALYAVKYAGCAVSSAEIEKFMAGRKDEG